LYDDSGELPELLLEERRLRNFQVMSTARGVALMRAVEMHKPAGERVSEDPYAKAFVNPVTLVTTEWMVRLGILDATLPRGMLDFVVARERYVHDLIVREPKGGLEQIVILGAGFDTRAYRTPELGSIPVFEVDHPATQRAKHAALRGVVTPPPTVRFVSVDFNRDRLGDRLGAAGYSVTGRTLFVWQGVTMYLSPQGIDATLGFIAKHSAPGSVVVFDYFYREILTSPRATYIRFMTRMMGEAMTFGIDEGTIAAFLEQRGFTDIVDIDGPGLRRLYWRGKAANKPMDIGGGIVSARVARSAA
jgi:methyltransferase (TIGR00027 family)